MRRSTLSFVLLSVLGLALVPGCDNDPTEATVANELPGATIEKTWFRTTLFTDPLATGQTSRTLRVGVGVEDAFAIARIHAQILRVRGRRRVAQSRVREAPRLPSISALEDATLMSVVSHSTGVDDVRALRVDLDGGWGQREGLGSRRSSRVARPGEQTRHRRGLGECTGGALVWGLRAATRVWS